MSEKITVFAIKDPEGNFWKTPKGKATWNSVGAAKNSWNVHNLKIIEIESHWSSKPYKVWRRKKWSEDAIGWSIVKLKEFRLVEEDQDG